ncbi:MAG: hypothetical protein ACFFE8_10485 [Candidatus Heimdallarchaeota archaeon]
MSKFPRGTPINFGAKITPAVKKEAASFPYPKKAKKLARCRATLDYGQKYLIHPKILDDSIAKNNQASFRKQIRIIYDPFFKNRRYYRLSSEGIYFP